MRLSIRTSLSRVFLVVAAAAVTTGIAIAGAGIQADLSIVVTDSPDPVAAGSNISYAISVGNSGPASANSVTVSDPLPAGTTFVSMTQNTGPAFTLTTPAVGGTGTVTATLATFVPGATASFTLVVRAAPASAPGTVFVNTATITSATADPNAGNNSTAPSTTVAAASVTTVPTLGRTGMLALAVLLAAAGWLVARSSRA